MENITIRFYYNRKVSAIKVHRALTGEGLKETKEMFDALLINNALTWGVK